MKTKNMSALLPSKIICGLPTLMSHVSQSLKKKSVVALFQSIINSGFRLRRLQNNINIVAIHSLN